MSTDLCVWLFRRGRWGINPYGCVLVGWGQAWPACWPAVSRFCVNSAFLHRGSFPGYMKWNCACWLWWGLLMDHFGTVKLCRFSICLAVMASYSQVSPMRKLCLDWDIGKTCFLHWCKEGGSGSVSTKVVLLEPWKLICHTCLSWPMLVRRRVWSRPPRQSCWKIGIQTSGELCVCMRRKNCVLK